MVSKLAGERRRRRRRRRAHAEGSSGKAPREGLPNASARATPTPTPPTPPKLNPKSNRREPPRAGEDAVESSTSMASSVHPPPPPGVGSIGSVVVIVDTELVGLVVVRPPRTEDRHAPPPEREPVPASRTSPPSLARFANRPSPTPAHSTYVDVDRPRFQSVIVRPSRPSVVRI